MNNLWLLPLLICLHLPAQEPEELPVLSAENLKKRASLALGYREGAQASLKQMEVHDFDPQAFLEGFLLGLEGKPLGLSPEEIREAMKKLQETINTRELELAAKNLKAGEQFLAANATAKGVVQTASGLQYRIVEPGSGEPFGESELAEKEVFVNYRGTLIDGKEFIESDDSPPEKLNIEEAISGFREALGLMPKGAKWVVFISPSLAYGDQRRSNLIGPNQLLIFEISLVDVRDPGK